MDKKIKVMSIFGTRPEAIKMAPLVNELKKQSAYFESTVTVTAQHRKMLDQVLEEFDIQPDYDLNVMKDKQTLSEITINVLRGLNKVMKDEKPDLVLVHGDTSTTFAASLTAFYNQIKVGHVEAGLRTWNKWSPYPEEINRQLTGVIADLHFAPTEQAKLNLLNEGKNEDYIFVTGNTVIDALKTTVQKDYSHPLLNKIGERRLILLTAHRRENLGEKMGHIFRAINRLVNEHKDIFVVYPVHLNPLVQEASERILGEHERISLIEPLNVIDFHNFMARAHIILTDSGGIQEEAPSLGVPVLVLRDTTERPEGIEAGTLKMAGTNEEDIFQLTNELLINEHLYRQMAQAVNPYGDGYASVKIVEAIKQFFKVNE